MTYRKMFFSFLFGVFALAVALVLYAVLADRIAWPLYATWLVALNTTTFWLNALDKALSMFLGDDNPFRTPELVLYSLSAAGGFVGGWLGRLVWHHKTNRQEHPWFPFIEGFSLFVHGVLIYYLFFRGN